MSAGLDVVHEAPGHSFTSKWLILHDPADLNLGSTGFIKLDVSLKGGGLGADAAAAALADETGEDAAAAAIADAAIDKNLVMPPIYGGATEQVKEYRRRCWGVAVLSHNTPTRNAKKNPPLKQR